VRIPGHLDTRRGEGPDEDLAKEPDLARAAAAAVAQLRREREGESVRTRCERDKKGHGSPVFECLPLGRLYPVFCHGLKKLAIRIFYLLSILK
jgi:hypothetical protein